MLYTDKNRLTGTLRYVVSGPAHRDDDAQELASLMASGASRRRAAEALQERGFDATGLRCIRAQVGEIVDD